MFARNYFCHPEISRSMKALVSLRTPAHPTEDPSSIDRAVRSLFPDAVLSYQDFHVSGSACDLARFAEILHNHRIRDAARRVLRSGVSGQTTRFFLGKQAATAGRVSFTDGDTVLGDIEVTIESDDIGALIDGVAPSTLPPADGRSSSRAKRRRDGHIGKWPGQRKGPRNGSGRGNDHPGGHGL
jgi:predicted RNA binding protein with dsRBD fold (UPF0201 family)